MAKSENTLGELNNILFDQLRRLNECSDDELIDEIDRAGAVSKVANQIISNANLVLKAAEIKRDVLDLDRKDELPKMLEG